MQLFSVDLVQFPTATSTKSVDKVSRFFVEWGNPLKEEALRDVDTGW